MSTATVSPATVARTVQLRYLWLELTRGCNLRCRHCYNDSGPEHFGTEAVSEDRWLELIDEAAALGCEHVQFIGGEPTAVEYLPRLIARARQRGISTIEVFTNGTLINDKLVEVFRENGVFVAMSLYSDSAPRHEALTVRSGSFGKTVDAIRRLRAADVPVRIAAIELDGNEGDGARVVEFARSLGVEDVGFEKARAFGRAEAATGRVTQDSELCGHCWRDSLCVMPSGDVAMCIMSRGETFGNVCEQTLAEICASSGLADARTRIRETVWEPRQSEPQACNPYPSCTPQGGTGPCHPSSTPPNPCSPHTCGPGRGPCYPLSK